MKKIYFLLLIVTFNLTAWSQLRTNLQVGGQISTSSAFLDASSTSTWNSSSNLGKGLIFPRINLVTFLTMTPTGGAVGLPTNYPTKFDGMIVYNSATGTAAIGGTSVTPGFYYYSNPTALTENGGTWVRLGDNTDMSSKEDKINKSSLTTLGNSDVLYPTQNAVKTYVDNQIGAGATSSLANAYIFVGNSSSVPTEVEMTGDIGINNLGATTIANNAITEAKIASKAVTSIKLDAGAGDAGRVATADAAGLVTYAPLTGSSVTGSNLTSTDITVTGGTGATLTAASLAIANNAITTPKISDSNVTYQKIQSTSSTNIVLGRTSAGGGVVEEIPTIGTGNVVRAISPTFTGTPTLPTGTVAVTQAPGDNTTAIATTAFVTAANSGVKNMKEISTSTYTLLDDDYYIVSTYSGGPVTITIPTPSAGIKGREFCVLETSGTQIVQFSPAPIGTNATVPANQAAKFICTGTIWFCITGF